MEREFTGDADSEAKFDIDRADADGRSEDEEHRETTLEKDSRADDETSGVIVAKVVDDDDKDAVADVVDTTLEDEVELLVDSAVRD